MPAVGPAMLSQVKAAPPSRSPPQDAREARGDEFAEERRRDDCRRRRRLEHDHGVRTCIELGEPIGDGQPGGEIECGGKTRRVVDCEIQCVLDAVELRTGGHRPGHRPRDEGVVPEPPPHRSQRLQADRHATGGRGIG